MITNITLENFKCFRHVSINPKLITVFIGPNGTGKSGVLQALLLLKQSRDNVDPLKLDGELVSFPQEAFSLNGIASKPETVTVSWSGHLEVDFEGSADLVEFDTILVFTSDAKLRHRRDKTRVRVDGELHDIPFDYRVGSHTITTPSGPFSYDIGGPWGFALISRDQNPDPFNTLWMTAFQARNETLGVIKIVPAARGITLGSYPLGTRTFLDISQAKGLGKQEEDLATTLEYSRRDVGRVSQLMARVTGVGFRTDTVPPVSVKPVSESPSGDFSLVVEGFGTNALVHLLFEVVRAVPGATVLIEEPEIHLHPRAQADLASVLVEQAKADEKQLIMTTHSEHIVGRLLTSVAEGTLSADELAIYSFEKDDEGVCSASEIEVNERGQVTGGLKSFFETDLDEMRRYVDALRAKA